MKKVYSVTLLTAVAMQLASCCSTSQSAEDLQTSGTDEELVTKWERWIPSATYENAPFERVLDDLEQVTECPIQVNWSRLEDIGVTADTPVTLSLRHIQAEELLTLTLKQLDLREYTPSILDDLWCRADCERRIMMIAPAEEFLGKTFVRTYDARDFLPEDSATDVLCEMIRKQVGYPDEWGNTSSIQHLNRQVIVRTTANNHRQVECIWEQLQEQGRG